MLRCWPVTCLTEPFDVSIISRRRIGIPLALALFTVLFHRHNQKLASTPEVSILSARCLQPKLSEEGTAFGILKKTSNRQTDHWIFMKNTTMHMTSPSISEAVDFEICTDIADVLTCDDVFRLLQTSLTLYELV